MPLLLRCELLKLAYLLRIAHLLVPELINLPLQLDHLALVADLNTMAVFPLPLQHLLVVLGALALVLHLTGHVRMRLRQGLLQLFLQLLHLRLQHLLRGYAREVLLLQLLILLQDLLAVVLFFFQLLLELF